MDKYSGMNKVESVVSPNGEIVKKKKPKSGFLKGFIVQSVISLAICGVLLGCKFIDFSPCKTALKNVKDAFCFDATEYVAEIIDGD